VNWWGQGVWVVPNAAADARTAACSSRDTAGDTGAVGGRRRDMGHLGRGAETGGTLDELVAEGQGS
jgi:hypothetical protein